MGVVTYFDIMKAKLKFTMKCIRWLVWLEILCCGCTPASHQQLQ